ncbi:hypothetical protein [Cupriavidus malaysiensis]|uniref:hypothetical protein n=1 Tax=Cupriavidus malaysiensis TaxID=367825 RepID=UPI0012FFC3BF|nr:hypothetical protein [Cupriavidus malaysiensis]
MATKPLHRVQPETERILTGGQGWPSFTAGHERAIRRASAHNWFVQPETPIGVIVDIEECRDDVNRLNAVMTEATRELLAEISDRMAQDYSDRSHILQEVFALHREGRYLASIPLSLATAEGIGLGETRKSIFNVRGPRPEIAPWIDNAGVQRHELAFLSALLENHPMAKPKAGYLSRHGVLHGRQLDYGSEIFSLQAISLLGFVGWVFSDDGLT